MSVSEVKKKHFRRFRKPLGVTSVPDDDELKHLEKIILGNTSTVCEDSSSEDSDKEIRSKKPKQDKPEKKPAWVDEDDNCTFGQIIRQQKKKCKKAVSGSKSYRTVAREQFEQIMGVPKWAERPQKNDDLVEDLLITSGNFIKKPKHLTAEILDFKKLRHLNFETKAEGPQINVVKFHPKSTIAMVAGVSGIVSLFQVDGKQNTKLQSLQFNKYPIHCASFLKNGEEFIIGSQYYRFFHCHNLMTGKSIKIENSKLINITKTKYFCASPNDDFIAVSGNTGQIFLLAASTKEYVDTLQMNCNVTALSFSQDGSFLYSHGDDGEVYVWDMKSRTCMRKIYDDGCLKGTSIALSKNGQFIACGSGSGVVNIYDRESIHSQDGTLPIKVLYNLVTPVTSALFNSSSEILAIASNQKDNAIKLVHCPSMTVFSNFPQFHSKMKNPLSLDFSPNSGFFAVGDSKGSAHLFRLKHYGNY